MHPAVAALPLEERGIVLGALLAHTPAATLARRLAGAAPRAAAALGALLEGSKVERTAALAALMAVVRAPVPAGLERAHPEWLRERFAREPSAVLRALRCGLPDEIGRLAGEVLAERHGERGQDGQALGPGAVAELQRIVFAGFVPLAGPGAPAGPRARRLLALTSRALEETIEARGAEALGVSLRGAPGPVVARAAAAIGDRLGPLVVKEAARRGPSAARSEARQLVAATGAGAARETAWELGCRALAGDFRRERGEEEGPGAIVAVAQRLPPARGRRLLEAAGLGDAL